jgi:hypothetical protein
MIFFTNKFVCFKKKCNFAAVSIYINALKQKNMKKVMMMLMMAVAVMTASAQNTLRENGSFTLQPKVGVGFGFISGSWDGGVDNKMRTGFVAGVEGEYYINDWFSAALGVNYAQQGWKFEASSVSSTYKLDFVNVPIVANFYVAQGLALKTGVQVGFLTSAKIESVDFKDYCEKTNISIPIGISGEYQNFVFDARYNIGLTNMRKNYEYKQRSDLITITLGYKFQL